MIPAQVIEQLRERLDPVEIIGRRIELKKAGSAYMARCPFHEDRTPSFRVFPDSRRFKCFGCGARGDVFEFLQRIDGKDFRSVVQALAAEAGLNTEEVSPAPTGLDGPVARSAAPAAELELGPLQGACDAALAHWEQRLWSEEGQAARRYLAARGIEEATARRFRLGYAPREWHDLEAALAARGHGVSDLVRAGLLRKSDRDERPVHDRFRGRIIFPFLNGGKHALGFAGRILDDASGSDEPRYLNGPETPLFRKGHLLFGLTEAQAAIHAGHRAILVEGYLDALALHQAGFRDAVASGGTALTEQQVALLQRRGCEDLVLLFDPDQPGRHAPVLAAAALLRAGLAARVAELPDWPPADPDAFVRAHGAAALEKVIATATPLTEWLLDRAIATRRGSGPPRALSVEQKLLVVKDLRPFVVATRDGLGHALFEQRIARRLGLYMAALRAELSRGSARDESGGQAGGAAWHA